VYPTIARTPMRPPTAGRPGHRALTVVTAFALVGTFLLSLAFATPAGAVDSYKSWNFLHDKQLRCHKMSQTRRDASSTWQAPLRFPDFNLIDGADGDNGYDLPRTTYFHNGDCPTGSTYFRLDITEVIQALTVSGQPRTYFHKGGEGYGTTSSEAKDYSYGHLHISDLSPNVPAPVFTKSYLDQNGAKTATHHPTWGPGRKCTANLDPVAQYKITGTTAPPSNWVYRERDGTGSNYKKYAMTGDMYGDTSRDFQGLQWGWVGKWDWQGNQIYPDDQKGFGTFRAMLPPGTIVTRCNVSSYTTRAWAAGTSDVVGRVTAVYVRTTLAGTELYGWIMHSYQALKGSPAQYPPNLDSSYGTRVCVMARHNAPDCAPPAPDADGDGVPDSSDACPTQYAQTANGCPPPPPNDTLGTGETLYVDQSRTSQDGRYRLTVQQDGNLVLYGPTGAVWATGTGGSNARLVMQHDGNLVLYNGGGGVMWCTNRYGSNARLVVQNDSNLVVYDGSGNVLWARVNDPNGPKPPCP
jgi:hypothetical protein